MSYRDKIEGNELDLSLNQLTEVPVKELAAATKATYLDLSCNCILTLPNDFASLTHLVKIDLSQNRLSELPANFGNLLNLHHLDLYANNLVTLPISFCRLKNLRWLDLKNNPLELKLKNVAGECLDEKECQACAKKVVVYMQSIESDLEREKQKKLKAAKEKETIERAKIEKELEEQRKLKKQEKERRKAESKAKKEAKLQENKLQDEYNNMIDKNNGKEKAGEEKTNTLGAKGFGCAKVLFYSILLVCLVLLLGLSYGLYAETVSTTEVKRVLHKFSNNFKSSLFQVIELIIYNIPKVKEVFLKFVYQYMQTLTYCASQIEQFVSVYF